MSLDMLEKEMRSNEAPINIFEWMERNVDELVLAICKDKGMNGPTVDPLLEQAQKMERPGQTFTQARKLLRRKLSYRNAEHYLPED